MKQFRKFKEREDGNIMILSAFMMVICILMMGLLIDVGMYLASYRKLKMAADTSSSKIEQMLPYYSYASDYQTVYREDLERNLAYLGYDDSNLISCSIGRYSVPGSSGGRGVTARMTLKDTYKCMLLPIIGINEWDINISKSTTAGMTVDHPYTSGNSYQVWGTDEEGID